MNLQNLCLEVVEQLEKSLRRRGVSSKVTLYAIENLKGKERKEVLEIKVRGLKFTEKWAMSPRL